MAYHASPKIGTFLLASRHGMAENPGMPGKSANKNEELQRLLRADPVRRILREMLTEHDVEQKALSLAIGKNHAYINQYLEKGKPAKLGEDVRNDIGEFFDVNPELFRSEDFSKKSPRKTKRGNGQSNTETLLKGFTPAKPSSRGEMQTINAGRDSFTVGDQAYVLIAGFDAGVSAGAGAMNIERPAPLYHNAFRLDWLRSLTMTSPDRLSVLRVVGDSMENTLHHGDHVLVDRSVSTFGHDGLYVLNHNEALFVKRVHCTKGSGLIDVISDNERYPTEENQDPDQYIVRGRVIWLGRNIG